MESAPVTLMGTFVWAAEGQAACNGKCRQSEGDCQYLFHLLSFCSKLLFKVNQQLKQTSSSLNRGAGQGLHRPELMKCTIFKSKPARRMPIIRSCIQDDRKAARRRRRSQHGERLNATSYQTNLGSLRAPPGVWEKFNK